MLDNVAALRPVQAAQSAVPYALGECGARRHGRLQPAAGGGAAALGGRGRGG